jgi:PAS domain-containing protein
VALSTMVCNDMLLPALLRRQNAERPFEAFRHWMLSARRVSIVVILLLAYVCYRLLGANASLATIGQLSFAAIGQLAPAMIGALIWKQANRRGVFAGLAAGCALWFYTLVLPLVAGGLRWSLDSFPLLPELLYYPIGIEVDPLTRGVVLSLTGNWLLFASVSWFSRSRVSEHWQAGRFIGLDTGAKPSGRNLLAVQVADLMALAARFVGEERARQSFVRFSYQQDRPFNPTQNADAEWIAHTERLLAGVLGASSTRAVVRAAIEGREMQVEDVVRIVDEASEVLQFNRALLQGAIENITQGISVVDQNLRLVAWNHRYLELFEYPEGLIGVGRPIADIIRYNAERGLCGPGRVRPQGSQREPRTARARTHPRTVPAQRGTGRGQGQRRIRQPVEDPLPRRRQPRPDAAAERRPAVLRLPRPPAGSPAAGGPGTGPPPGQLAALGRGPDHRPAGHLAPGKRAHHPRAQPLPPRPAVRRAGRGIQGAGPRTGRGLPPGAQPPAHRQ